MIKRILLPLTLMVAALALFVHPAGAEEAEPAHIIGSTRPIPAELREHLDAWLAISPPSTAIHYAVTYKRFDGVNYHASLAGMTLPNPDARWSITGDTGDPDDENAGYGAVWLGTVMVEPDGAVTLKTPTELEYSQRMTTAKMAALFPVSQLGAGGGAYVRFPWQPAKAVQYGILGLHSVGGYGLDEPWGAVDLISGTDMGSGAANDKVYTSAAGEIVYVCDDAQTVAVRLSGGSDDFLYAHLLPNALLEEENTFAAGAVLGSLKHGSFLSAGCGGAVQKANHWHLHWGFITAGSNPRTFQAEGCILQKSASFTAGQWTCGNTTIRPLGYLYHYGNVGIDPSTGTVGVHLGEASGGGPSFWEYILGGLRAIFDYFVTSNLPEHQSASTLLNPILQSVKIVFRIALVILHGNFNFVPAVQMVGFTIGIRIALSSFLFMIGLYRVIR